MTVDGSVVGSIGPGLLLLVGIEAADTDEDVDAAVEKVVNTRVFPDEAGRMVAGSVNGRAAARLAELARMRQAFAHPGKLPHPTGSAE